jgi:hypothetical protein
MYDAWKMACLSLLAAFPSVATLADEHANNADTADHRPGVAPLFADDALLEVTIQAPLTTLMKDRPNDEYLDGIFSFNADDGTEQTLDLKIRTRGNYRREEKHCDFAPIRLNFRKKQVVDTLFDGQDKLKLVTHCKSTKPHYEQLVLREYLAYRILQALTDKSFGVRLLRINYVDTEGSEPMTKLGFVIEDDKDVAERHGMQTIKRNNLAGSDLEPVQQNLVNVFQYLIGNTEYSLFNPEPDKNCCHNTDFMAASEDAPVIPLPYDFDFAGIVNAHYAQPNPRFEHTDVRTRLYRGQCTNNDQLPETLQRFIDNKEAIYGVVDEVELLNSRSQKYVIRYLDSFYRHISDQKSVDARFIDKCEDPPTP